MLCSGEVSRRCAIKFFKELFQEKGDVHFLDFLRDPIAILMRDGRVHLVNSALATLMHSKRDAMQGMDCRELELFAPLWNAIAGSVLRKKEQSERINFKALTFDVTITPISVENEVRYLCVAFKDVTSFIALEKQLMKRNKELIIANTLSGTFINSMDMETVYSDLLDKLLLITEMDVGWVVIREHERFTLKSFKGMSIEFLQKLKAGSLDAFYQSTLDTNDPLYVMEDEKEGLPAEIKKEGILFMAAIPLRSGEHMVGLVTISSRMPTHLDFDLASILSIAGNHLSIIAEKIQLFEETQRLAVTDGLTGLYNARFFYTALSNEVARTERYRIPFSLILFDIDNFKALNDTQGHQAGDEALRNVAQALKKSARGADVVARYGGEEFIVVLPNTSKDEALLIGQRFKEAVEALYRQENPGYFLTLSGGIASFPQDAGDSKTLLYAADMAMYAAKGAGKNQIRKYEGMP